MLSPEQQERFARHLLLDEFDQDKLTDASFHVCGTGTAALWAARYLAASGCGRVVVDQPAWHDELRRLGPWTDLSGPAEKKIIFSSPDGGAVEGAEAAMDAICEVQAR
ncbi:MAG TPA: hypothetical protein VFL36_09400 [Myxococcales bacterium]|nr:hypothetical protein [Myxococcales bacterium]